MIETLNHDEEFERPPYREIEKKYLPLFPEMLDTFRSEALPIEQVYLSHPDEPFSLRLRETLRDGSLIYEAALKDRGQITEAGLDRLEIETEISPETYRLYKADDAPVLRKLRAEPYRNVTIDWFDSGHVQVECEHPISWTSFLDQHKLPTSSFTDMTGDRYVDNEWRAHTSYRQQHEGKEAFSVPQEFDSESVAHELWRQSLASSRPVTVTIAGRSGSGKTTAIREIETVLAENGTRTIVLSTDDYHRGKTWLEQYKGSEWTEWDAPIVYDVEALAADLARLQNGETVARRRFDFAIEEPVLEGVVEPAPIILVEGIYARHPQLAKLARSRYELPTALATCVGRRLLRDVRERPQFSDPARSLRYMLEHAEPAYRDQSSAQE